MQETSAALIDQLVYIDNFTMNQDTPNLDVDGQLSLDLAAFADDSFIFADEEKPDRPVDDDGNDDFHHPDDDKPDPLPVSFRDLPAANNPLEHNWFAQDEMMHMPHENTNSSDLMSSVDTVDGHGHQLTSTLNDKIQATKRNKVQNHNVHDNNLSGPFSRTDSPSSHNQPNVFGRQPNLLDSGPTQTSHTSLQALNRTSVNVPNLSSSRDSHAAPGADGIPDLSSLPKFPVPPGAKSSLKRVGLTQNQIDLLSALIAQHQTALAGPTEAQAQVPSLPSNGTRHLSEFAGKKEKEISGLRSSINSPASNYSSENSSVTSSVLGSQSQAGDTDTNGDLPTPNVDSEKRRRNTAASARFRVKKKLKERDMDNKIQRLTEAIKSFEMKIEDLEMENRLLKGLIIERGNRDSEEELKKLRDRAKFADE